MSDAPVPPPQPAASVANPLLAEFKRWVQWIPPKARLAVLAGIVVLVGSAIYMGLTSGSARLNLVCRHNLRAADLSVSVDGKLAFSEQISGASKKRLGIFKSGVAGSFSRSLTLPSGEHLVKVHLKSPADGYDQTRSSGVNLVRGKGASLQVTAQRGAMSLIYDGPSLSGGTDGGRDYAGAMRSLMVTAAGSVVSAAIGYLVQEFLRSRKKA